MSDYPGALDAFTNPGPTDDLDTAGVFHDEQHANINDAMEAVQGELGTNPSGGSSTVAARFTAVESSVAVRSARVFPLAEYGTVGTSDDTATLVACLAAVVAAGGGVIEASGVITLGGALQDTSGANAQLVLPAVDYVDTEAISVTIRGPVRPPVVPSVVGATPIPDNCLVIKSTLASGTGAVIGAQGPAGTFGGFTNIHFRLEDLIVRTVANPTLTAVDARRVAAFSIGGRVIVDAGSYDIDALAQPTTATSFGVRCPGINNGAETDIDRLDVAGFYQGVEHSEHLNADHIVTWGCRVGLVPVAANHASHIKRFMPVHCTTGIKPTGAHALKIEQYAVEHANSSQGWRQTTYDIDDPSNYLSGNVHWWAVLAGTGPHNSFTVNGAGGVTQSRLGSAPAGGSALTVQDENSNVSTSVTQIDFQGAGVTTTAGTGEVVVNIPGTTGSQLLMQDGVTSPPVPIENEAGSDWLYQD